MSNNVWRIEERSSKRLFCTVYYSCKQYAHIYEKNSQTNVGVDVCVFTLTRANVLPWVSHSQTSIFHVANTSHKLNLIKF